MGNQQRSVLGARWRRLSAAGMTVFALVGVSSVASSAPLLDVVAPSDTVRPVVVSVTVSPGTADVTSGDARFAITVRATDESSGIEQVDMGVDRSIGTAGGIRLVRTTGDDRDQTLQGTLTVSRYAPPGRYGFYLFVRDRVGNRASFNAVALAFAGLASGVDITDATPDGTAPSIHRVMIAPSTVDVRSDSVTAQLQVSARDGQTGVNQVALFFHPPPGFEGGVPGSGLQLTSGTTNDGVWTGTATFPKHIRNGPWTLGARLIDRLGNRVDLSAGDLAAAGVTNSFEVLSVEDLVGPRFRSVSIEPSEVNVRERDQSVRLRVRITDDLSGIAAFGAGNAYHDVSANVFDPVTLQGAYVSSFERVSGTALDGIYEQTFVVPRLSATGSRTVRLFARDGAANSGDQTSIEPDGGPLSLLVYSSPLPPLGVAALVGDGLVTVRWSPPVSDGGVPVTRYIVRESPGGALVEVAGDARSVVIGGLPNGTAHTFTVTAVNKAGSSEPSASTAATPIAPPTVVVTAPPSTVVVTAPPPTVVETPKPSGYWMVSARGSVYAFGDARWLGDASAGGAPVVDLEPSASRAGYWVVDAAGRVFTFGDARYFGSAGGLASSETVTSISATPGGRGYWLFTDRGRVLAFGGAPFLGDMSTVRLNGRVLDSVPTPTGRGYYMVAADGGVFSFGDARFAGSMGGARLNAPVESLVPAAGGSGYWLVASDGGVFAFGPPFLGSMGSRPLNMPVTGMVGSTTGRGYLMVAEDGGIFAFGDVEFSGSLGASTLSAPIKAVAAA